ncbi:DNA mismatch repair protein MutS [Pseudoduganella sp. LjRoot289]|uniref:MutS-related protein n=1 Tax=Pseudoduganella sp. LjRoot289 TaxID=3342314 RepID=UPI003ECD17FD
MFKILAGFNAPVIDYPFARSDVAKYAQYEPALSASEGTEPALVDEQTWSDMLLDQYADRLARETSIFGQQELHRRLRGGAASAASIDRVRSLVDDDAGRNTLHATCQDLRCAQAEIAEWLFGPGPQAAPRWSKHLQWLPWMFLLSLPLTLFWWPASLLAGAAWIALMAVQVSFYDQSQQWERLVATLQLQLRVHSLLGGLADGQGGAAGVDRASGTLAGAASVFRSGAALAGRISRKLGRSPMESVVPGMKEYGEWVGLTNIRRYFEGRDVFLAQRDFLRLSYRMLAGLEADLALAREFRTAPASCWNADGRDGPSLRLDGVVHPLLEQAMPLTFTLQDKGAFISGQNGIGKSTLLRTLGLNLITARAFGFCYARSAALPPLPVYSSMQSEDSLAGGESLYIAELRRAHELLALAGQGRAVFIIDEIFRGTNHLESVSGAAAVLDTLAQQGTVIVSSHNLVLAPLLAHRLAPLCVSAEGGQLRVRPGVLAHTNGLALLGARGFGPAIEAKAAQVHNWLGEYLAHPDDCGHVLAPVNTMSVFAAMPSVMPVS